MTVAGKLEALMFAQMATLRHDMREAKATVKRATKKLRKKLNAPPEMWKQ